MNALGHGRLVATDADLKNLVLKVAELEQRDLKRAQQLRSLARRIIGAHGKKLQRHEERLDTHADQLTAIHTELSEVRRSQASLEAAVGRVLDRQTVDSLHIEQLVKARERDALFQKSIQSQLSTFAGHLSRIAKASKVAK